MILKPILLYVTAKDKSQALHIGRTLVEERLATCINVLDPMTSVYRWEGKIEQASEAVLIVKASGKNYQLLERRIKQLHSYECPCILRLEIDGGNSDYLTWLNQS